MTGESVTRIGTCTVQMSKRGHLHLEPPYTPGRTVCGLSIAEGWRAYAPVIWAQARRFPLSELRRLRAR